MAGHVGAHGIGVAVFTALMAQVLFGRPVWTFVAGLLIAVDGLNVVHSRIALLDIHLAFWVSLGFLILLLDRRWIDRRTERAAALTPVAVEPEGGEAGDPDDEPGRSSVALRVPSPFLRPWRLAGRGGVRGATAVKWSGAMAIPAAVLLTYIWETTGADRGTDRASQGVRAHAGTGVVRGRGRVRDRAAPRLHAHVDPVVHALRPERVRLPHPAPRHAGYHRDLRATALDPATDTYTPTHVYYSKAWTWIPMLRPVSYFVEDLGPDIRQILAIGNPVLFWGTMWTIPVLRVGGGASATGSRLHRGRVRRPLPDPGS